MMRELKANLPIPLSPTPVAAAQIPMMRELKVSRALSISTALRGCSPNPYDEGTESPPNRTTLCRSDAAAAQIPMMRELKAPILDIILYLFPCCSPNPYDEGTESSGYGSLASLAKRRCSPNPYDEGTERILVAVFATSRHRCSPNPYDEGTERLRRICRAAAVILGCSPNPYDEGTERHFRRTHLDFFHYAAAQIPMMRELKVANPRKYPVKKIPAAAQIPMMRELKE